MNDTKKPRNMLLVLLALAVIFFLGITIGRQLGGDAPAPEAPPEAPATN